MVSAYVVEAICADVWPFMILAREMLKFCVVGMLRFHISLDPRKSPMLRSDVKMCADNDVPSLGCNLCPLRDACFSRELSIVCNIS